MSNTDDIAREPSTDDLRLVDLLYGELDGDEAARLRDELDEAGAAELAAFEGLRALMREVPDEDPPAALSAQLLHAAAEAAPSRGSVKTAAAAAAGGGFIARLLEFFRPLVSSPALAAATMFVLVAGVAGALYVTGNFETTEQQLAVSADTAAVPATPGAAAESDDDFAAPAADEPARSATLATEDEAKDLGIAEAEEPPAEPAMVPAPRREQAVERDPDRTRGTVRASKAGKGKAKKAADPAPPPKAEPAKKSTGVATQASRNTQTKAGGGSGVSAGAGDSPLVDMEDVAEEAPSPRPADDQKRDTTSTRDQRTSELADLHERATQAAADGECDAVISLGARVQKLDPSYYKNSFRADKRLARCFAAQRKPAVKKK